LVDHLLRSLVPKLNRIQFQSKKSQPSPRTSHTISIIPLQINIALLQIKLATNLITGIRTIGAGIINAAATNIMAVIIKIEEKRSPITLALVTTKRKVVNKATIRAARTKRSLIGIMMIPLWKIKINKLQWILSSRRRPRLRLLKKVKRQRLKRPILFAKGKTTAVEREEEKRNVTTRKVTSRIITIPRRKADIVRTTRPMKAKTRRPPLSTESLLRRIPTLSRTRLWQVERLEL
jgi:hypothetical protein